MKNLFDLTGRVAIVTGASSGLGVDFAKALANQGANLALVARREEKLKEVQKEIEKLGVTCRYYVCDVTKTDQIKDVVERVEKDFGRIDILVNNAGLGLVDAAEKTTDEMWRTMVDTNLNGVYFFAREVGKVMLKQKYGRIINIGSIHSTVSMKGLPVTAYCATKGGVLRLWQLNGQKKALRLMQSDPDILRLEWPKELLLIRNLRKSLNICLRWDVQEGPESSIRQLFT